MRNNAAAVKQMDYVNFLFFFVWIQQENTKIEINSQIYANCLFVFFLLPFQWSNLIISSLMNHLFEEAKKKKILIFNSSAIEN